MITEWFIELGLMLAEWLLGLLAFELPTWFTDSEGLLVDLSAQVGGLGVWIPWSVMTAVALTVIGNWLLVYVVKIVKQLLAHIPQIGGAG